MQEQWPPLGWLLGYRDAAGQDVAVRLPDSAVSAPPEGVQLVGRADRGPRGVTLAPASVTGT